MPHRLSVERIIAFTFISATYRRYESASRTAFETLLASAVHDWNTIRQKGKSDGIHAQLENESSEDLQRSRTCPYAVVFNVVGKSWY